MGIFAKGWRTALVHELLTYGCMKTSTRTPFLLTALLAAVAITTPLAEAAKPAKATPATRQKAGEVVDALDRAYHGYFPGRGGRLEQMGERVHDIRVVSDKTQKGVARDKTFIDGTHVRTDLTYGTGTIVSYRKGVTVSSYQYGADGRMRAGLANAHARSENELLNGNPTIRHVVAPMADGRGVRVTSGVAEGMTGIHAPDGTEVGGSLAHLMGPRRELRYLTGTTVTYRPKTEWAGPAGAPTYTRGTTIAVLREGQLFPTETFRAGKTRAAE